MSGGRRVVFEGSEALEGETISGSLVAEVVRRLVMATG